MLLHFYITGIARGRRPRTWVDRVFRDMAQVRGCTAGLLFGGDIAYPGSIVDHIPATHRALLPLLQR